MYYNVMPYPYGTSQQNHLYGHRKANEMKNDDVQIKKQMGNMNRSWDGGHTHAHYGSTTCQDGHNHLHPGVTSRPIPTPQGHVHKIYGHTTFDDEHIHSYEAYTSPPIKLPNGYHTHYVEFRTTENDGHIHIIRGFTAASKD